MEHADVHILGAGLAGLTAAAYVRAAGLRPVVHDARTRAGGRAITDERDGFHFDLGPHALYQGGPATEVLAELGITPRGAVPPVKGVSIRDGRAHVAPGGVTSLLRTSLLGLRDKVEAGRLLATIGRRSTDGLGSMTVQAWIDDAVSRPTVRALVHALVRLTTYANAPDVLSADVAVEQIQRALGDGVLYLDGGWSQLVDALLARAGIDELAPALETIPDAAVVIVATGSPQSATSLTGVDFTSGSGPAAEVACLDLGVRGRPTHDFALGIDVPLYASRHSIAEGHAPPGHDHVAVAEYLGTGVDPDRCRLEAFARLSGAPATETEHGLVTARYLHRMVACTALPTAALGGLAGRPDVEIPDLDGVFVAGDWVGSEGHLADAALASARRAAKAAIAHVARRRVVG